ncbi:hypothetical protein C8R45DRAFT_939811 [Mycena sanguinolenta]|nr:hypothetical protein C8R45DRAFT_939811 [Mycena sanguinolenta]
MHENIGARNLSSQKPVPQSLRVIKRKREEGKGTNPDPKKHPSVALKQIAAHGLNVKGGASELRDDEGIGGEQDWPRKEGRETHLPFPYVASSLFQDDRLLSNSKNDLNFFRVGQPSAIPKQEGTAGGIGPFLGPALAWLANLASRGTGNEKRVALSRVYGRTPLADDQGRWMDDPSKMARDWDFREEEHLGAASGVDQGRTNGWQCSGTRKRAEAGKRVEDRLLMHRVRSPSDVNELDVEPDMPMKRCTNPNETMHQSAAVESITKELDEV